MNEIEDLKTEAFLAKMPKQKAGSILIRSWCAERIG